MSVALLLIIVSVSATVVRIGAFSLELTGMPWDQAKFQALSAFSTAGYTTRESEQVVGHPMRRRIVSTLIVLGNAGIVTSIGTFAGTIMTGEPMELATNAGIMVVGVFILFAVLRHDGLTGRLRRRVQKWLQKRYDFSPPRADELLRLDEGYGLTRIAIDKTSPVLGKALKDLDLKSWRVQVLGIERDGDYHPVPRGEDRFLDGDHLVVYGPESAITKVFKPRERTRLTVMGDGGLTITPTGHSAAFGPPSATEPMTARVAHDPTMMAAQGQGVPGHAPPAMATGRAAIGHEPTVMPAQGAVAEPSPAPPASRSGRGRYSPVQR